ncbi:NAD(P)/FAD-dependent oxidoreductase [Afifella marina]|uniref:Glycine/D-amino acid oxidase n=1 Tax=Afifella marina DSM 2698 TaxID=1120955 RepID=A0A1G5NXV3_AFIMA|nr:FAD-binding oxidoreductase [Afifella marina]MBK1624507.1 FAD-dependent oxidoreductase [Afifella marina DSM 2698]MBK1628239.1 FAD-dependent oxidoreductase [Afifella marina]MBK5916673.1 amino acid oxidase [Afifella marina]RAI19025.1 amino acid oxidase [Afifella marina DSM 2698]SCZ42163.1 Glycine/D-amino acid oxidase [Afifella marina DSM 2698]
MATITLRQPSAAQPSDRAFWLQDIGADAVTPPVAGSVRADIAIVGGGYTGLWTALRIKEAAPDTRVVLLEADFCGSGASGRNGGQVHSWFAEIDRLSAVVGEEEARSLCLASVDAIAELEELQRSGLVDMDLRLDGWLWTASSIAQEGAWARAVAMTEAAGAERFELLSAEDIERRTGSSASYIGVVEKNAGTVQPAKLACGLRDLAISRGVTVHEHSPVQEIVPGATLSLRTPNGVVEADKVVLAANAWLSALPELRRHMYVVDSRVVATGKAPAILDRIGWRDGASICDSQDQVLYYQRTDEGRVVLGRGTGGVAFRGDFGPSFNRNPEGVRDNVRELHRLYPKLRGVPIEFDWAGPIDCVPEHVPVFDHLKGQPNIFFGMGYNGTGIAQAPIGGRILASLALGRKDRWSQCGLVGLAGRASLPPEPFRYIGAKLVGAAIERKNEAEIRNRVPDPVTRLLIKLMPGASEH